MDMGPRLLAAHTWFPPHPLEGTLYPPGCAPCALTLQRLPDRPESCEEGTPPWAHPSVARPVGRSSPGPHPVPPHPAFWPRRRAAILRPLPLLAPPSVARSPDGDTFSRTCCPSRCPPGSGCPASCPAGCLPGQSGPQPPHSQRSGRCWGRRGQAGSGLNPDLMAGHATRRRGSRRDRPGASGESGGLQEGAGFRTICSSGSPREHQPSSWSAFSKTDGENRRAHWT